jgi:hypothetical protein
VGDTVGLEVGDIVGEIVGVAVTPPVGVAVGPAWAAFAKPIANTRTTRRRMRDFVPTMTTPCFI